QENYEQGLIHLKRAVVLESNASNTNKEELATYFNNTGQLYKEIKNLPEALEYYNKSLNIRKEILPCNHPLIASSYNNIGTIIYSQRLYEEAKKKF
ncbi:unnamed protein product, partial [Didymodactylos carnosus]